MNLRIISTATAAENAQETHPSVGAEGQAHHEGGFPPFQTENFAPQIVWLVVIFGVLYILMSRLALPRVGGILERRSEKIASDLEASRDMQAKAQAAAVANNETIRLRREEALAIGREAQQNTAAETLSRRSRAELEASEKIRAAEGRIADAKTRALANVEQIAIEAAGSIVEKLTGSKVDKDRLSAEFRNVKSS